MAGRFNTLNALVMQAKESQAAASYCGRDVVTSAAALDAYSMLLRKPTPEQHVTCELRLEEQQH